MQVNPDFYYIPTGIDRDVAEIIKKQCATLPLEKSVINTADNKNPRLDVQWRNSENSWLSTDCWIAGMMKHLIECANKNFFHYDISEWSDKIQYTVYDGGRTHYKWHTDISESTINKDYIRKLSMSLLLSDPEEYEGGELQLMFAGDSRMKTFKPQMGDAIIFSSNTRHRVRPVKSGKRISLVGWYAGPPFR